MYYIGGALRPYSPDRLHASNSRIRCLTSVSLGCGSFCIPNKPNTHILSGLLQDPTHTASLVL